MVTHDEQIGQVLDKLDELGVADNTIVMYSPIMALRTTPGRCRQYAVPQPEGYETGKGRGAFRVFMRWPGQIKAARC